MSITFSLNRFERILYSGFSYLQFQSFFVDSQLLLIDGFCRCRIIEFADILRYYFYIVIIEFSFPGYAGMIIRDNLLQISDSTSSFIHRVCIGVDDLVEHINLVSLIDGCI